MNQEKWKLARQSELIDGIAYYHIIFTVPDVLNVFFLANQKTMYDLLFKSASQTLLTLSADKQHLGARPGIISVLHTWGQQLNFHPHLHLAVSGGGLRKDGTFVETTHKGFFLPLPMVKKMFRGKFLAGFKLLYDTGQLTFPKSTVKLKNPNEWKAFINRLYEKDWCPFIKETFNGHGNALQYLAR